MARRVSGWVLLVALLASAQDAEIADLVADLGSADAYARKAAREQLVALGEKAVPALGKLLSKAPAGYLKEPQMMQAETMRRMAAALLADIGPAAADAVPALTNALGDPSEELPFLAARALARIGAPSRPAAAALIRLARARGWRHRFAARDALVAIGVPVLPALFSNWVHERSAWMASVFRGMGAKTVPLAIQALASPDENRRVAAADLVAAAGPRAQPATPVLVKALHDERGVVRRHAALALGALGREGFEAVPALVALANDEKRRAVPQALEAMGAIVRDIAEAERRKPAAPTAVGNAIALGLQWLAAHQDADGKWDCAGFDKHASRSDPNHGAGAPAYDIGVTGLAVLAFLETGRLGDEAHAGLRYLVGVQGKEGCFGTRTHQHYMYRHAFAALAVCEGARRTGDPVLKDSAQRALDFIARSRNVDLAWRYKPRAGDNDTSITGWMVESLHAGELAGLRVDRDALEGALRWVDQITDPATGRAGYNKRGGGAARPASLNDVYPPGNTRSMTAVAAMIRLHAGERATGDSVLARSIDQCVQLPPQWDRAAGFVDFYYWLAGSRALYHAGGAPWRKWRKALTKAVLPQQHPRRAGRRAGSWDPAGPWGHDGGRVYATAAMVLALAPAAGHTRPLTLPLPVNPRLRPAIATLKAALGHSDEIIRATARAALAGLRTKN